MRSSYVVAGLIAVAGVVWIGSGLVFPHQEAPQEHAIDARRAAAQAPAPRVRVRDLTASETITPLVVHGQTKASRRVLVRAETTGRVVEVPVDKGARVDAGTVLARLDMGNRRERLEEAQALVAQRELEFNASSSLAQRDFTSRTRLAEARAELEKARAELAAIRKEINDTTIRAPFAAVLNARAVEVGDVLAVGGEVATLIDLDPVTVAAEVSERAVGRLTVGTPAQVVLIDGRTVDGQIAWIAASATTGTRTYPIEVAIANPDQDIPEGMTAEVRLPLERTLAHLVSPAVLTLNDAGQLGVKLVDGDDTVRFVPVQVVRDSADGIWLTGLPDQARVITVGQEFVAAGQAVVPVPDGAAPGGARLADQSGGVAADSVNGAGGDR
ncbi:efflux RND transporter periplasmic adaptor subunit [Novispirillum sp. DQ9]|uniref:efflux RND transporter periplasmic adaptor subunit n=1 Tax=Novispirillum sp. DQ9 TaxID=3398612 RepID=UPI003C7EB6BC